MKILVTGAGGFVGSAIHRRFPDEVVAAPSLREASVEEIRQILKESGAEAVIHTAAISDTGVCEKDPEASYRANVELPIRIARAACGQKLVFFSSDQVYTGCETPGPYREEEAKPANVYGRHKLEMEQRISEICPEAVLLRAEWMYDFVSFKPNYYMNVLGGRLFFCRSQYRGVTYVREVAEVMKKVLQLPGGVYNFGSETDQTIWEITENFLKEAGREELIREMKAVEGPHNLWMNCEKARKEGLAFSSVSEGLRRCLREAAGPCGV